MQVKIQPPNKRRWLIRLPIWLRGLSGFLSSLTSAAITVIFSLTIYEAVLKTDIGYPDAIKTAIMVIGPLISSFQFINVGTILAAIVEHLNDPKNGDEIIATTDEQKKTVGIDASTSIERQVYGDLNVLLRSIAGFISTMVINFASLVFAYVIHLGVIAGKGLPSDLEMIVVISGPILTSWTFMRAEKIVRSLLKIDSITERIRRKIHSFTAAK